MKCCTMSCRRPSNSSSRPTGPSGLSKVYSFSILTIGSWRRLAFSASRARVRAFSSARSSTRAARHSSGVATFGRFTVLSFSLVI